MNEKSKIYRKKVKMMKKNGKIKNEAEEDMRRSEDYIINNTSNIIVHQHRPAYFGTSLETCSRTFVANSNERDKI